MPIRRRSDGEIEEKVTKPLKKSAPARPDAGDAPSDRQGVRGKRHKESLFQPAGQASGSKDRFEDQTVAMGSRRQFEDEKTRIIASRRRVGAATGQSAGHQEDPMLDPPVGWLVIVGGPGKGNVLTLGNGMNGIGRSESARVRVNFGDDTIARSNHARLAYEPRNRRYLLSHGEGSNLTYVNGEVVMESIELESGAMIEMGDTKFRFQALCSADFDWPDLDD